VGNAESRVWAVDPSTLRDVILDRTAVHQRLNGCPALERVWILSLLGRTEEAIAEGRVLLESATDRIRPLLALAQAYQYAYRWREAASLQEEALQLASSRAMEALVRHEIGRRLFDEARHRDAAYEFEWAHDLYRAVGREGHAAASRRAWQRAREVAGRSAREMR
jgi:tetratricopeptide (TPR) repeat protein